MQCSETNIMCKGGHLTFAKNKIFVLHPITKEVIELHDSKRIKHLAPKGEILLLAVEKEEYKVDPLPEDFMNIEKIGFVRRFTNAKKVAGSMHLDRAEDQAEINDRKRVAAKIVSRILHEGKAKNNRDQIISRSSEELLSFFEARGFIDGQEIISSKLVKGDIKGVAGLLGYLKTVPSMAEELGLSKGSYQSNNFDLSPLLLKLNPTTGAKPAKPIFLSPSNVEQHAVIRFFERIQPRLRVEHVLLARELIKERDMSSKKELKAELGLLLKKDGLTLQGSIDAKNWLSKIITDKVGSSLNADARPTFADRSSEKNSTGRFILSLSPELTGSGSTLEVVCDVLREKPGSDSIEIRVLSIWEESKHHSKKGFNDSVGSSIISKNSIWDFDFPDKDAVKELARVTEKVIFDALI